MNPLMARLKKASKIAETSSLAENEILGNVECAHIGIPALDIAFTGEVDSSDAWLMYIGSHGAT